MADLELPPDFTLGKKTNYDTILSEFENGVEQRRSRREQKIREWVLQYRNRPNADLATIQTLFDNCKGAYASFTWLHPIDGNTYTVRFKEDTLEVANHNYGFQDFQFGLIEVL